MAVTTRAATGADIPHLVALMREFYGEADYALDDAWATAAFAALLRDGRDGRDGSAWLAFEGGVPAGYTVLTVRFSMEFGGRDGFIDDLFVRAPSRRRGVASALLAAALGGCESRGLLALHVETAATNLAAVSLYRLFGLADRQRLLLTRRLDDRHETALSADPS